MPRTGSVFAVVALLSACATQPQAPVEHVFGLFGDAPYSHAQVHAVDALIDAMNAEPLSFVVHVGDITSGTGPCSDEWLEARQLQFGRLRHPFVLLAGDNEWTDCHRGGFDPIERLQKWRSLFCGPVPQLGLERQAGEYCENLRWRVGSTLYVGLNVPGSNNNLGRTPAMDAEYEKRMRAVFAWLDDSFALADRLGVGRVALLLHANPFVTPRAGQPDGFLRLRAILALRASHAKPPLVLIHGNTHRFRDDEPLPGLQRIEVYGSLQVRWLLARVRPGAPLEVDSPQ